MISVISLWAPPVLACRCLRWAPLTVDYTSSRLLCPWREIETVWDSSPDLLLPGDIQELYIHLVGVIRERYQKIKLYSALGIITSRMCKEIEVKKGEYFGLKNNMLISKSAAKWNEAEKKKREKIWTGKSNLLINQKKCSQRKVSPKMRFLWDILLGLWR